MPRPIIVAAPLFAAVLLVGACSEKNASASDIQEVLEDAGATKDQADCASTEIDDALTQDEMNDLAKTDTAKEIDDKIDEKIQPILAECLQGEGSTDDGETDESTTSTTAEGESTESTTTTTTG